MPLHASSATGRLALTGGLLFGEDVALRRPFLGFLAIVHGPIGRPPPAPGHDSPPTGPP